MTDEQTARKIVSDAQYDGELNHDVSHGRLEDAIVRALQQAYANGFTNGHTVGINHEANREVLRMCHEARMCNGIVDYSDPNATGVVRRVLGKLPLTADGCVFGIDAPTVYAWHHGRPVGAACVAESQQCDECGNDDMYEARECYSTRDACQSANEMVDGDAAEAAKEEKK